MRKYGVGLWIGTFFSAAVGAAAETPRTIAVSGTCVRSVLPDRGAITLTVDAKDPEAKRAQAAATRQYEAMREKINRLKLADGEISTSEYVTEEIREWEHGKMVSHGYHSRIGLRVETSDHARLNEAIDVASREGVKDVGGLQLFISTGKLLSVRMVCLRDASEQARAKAEALAAALGAKVGLVETIVENSTSDAPSPPGPAFRGVSPMNTMAAKVAAPTIDTAKTEISTSVQVTFGLR